MSINWILYAEVRAAEGWIIPPGLPPQVSYAPAGGQFGWMKDHWISDALFFGKGALFPFSRGRPPGVSEFCRRFDAYWSAAGVCWDTEVEFAAHWIDYEGLYVDLWSEPTLLVASHTAVRFATLFGDGTGAYPIEALRAAGANEDEFWALHKSAAPATGAIDRVHGAGRGEIEKLQADQRVAVTWQTSVDWLLPSCAESFHGLCRHAKPIDLRVIALRG